MKKLLALALSVMILACGTVSAMALPSPDLKPDEQPDNDRPNHNDRPNNNRPNFGGQINTGKPGDINTGKSPSTGVSSAYAIYAALVALTCGGVAVIAKKKVSE
jgi:hypothetical protein